jgi:hypothetical protein
VCNSVELIEDKDVIITLDESGTPITDTAHLIKQFLDSCTIEHLDRVRLQDMVFDIYNVALERMATSC